MSLGRSRFYLRARDVVLRTGRGNPVVDREDLARVYLRGDGIEIGAMFKPLRVPAGARVRYVDRVSRERLFAMERDYLQGVGVRVEDLVAVDVLCEADRLESIPDGSQDFVVANHVLEHVEDPVLGLQSMLRVLRPGGVLLLTLPDPRASFDDVRARTTVEHVLRDHAEGPSVSRRGHYEEWAVHIEGAVGERIAERVAEYDRDDARHHFHVWELPDFLRLLLALDLPADLLRAEQLTEEFAVVLRRH